MRQKTLVLNKAYYPINVVDWKKAIELSLNDKNIILSKYDEYVSSVSRKFQLPSVIVISDYCGMNTVLRYSKQRLFVRDGHICSYCGKRFSRRDLTVDHVHPKSRGGITSWKNCVSACLKCNSKKADKTPTEAGMELKITPFEPRYDYEYFLNWNGFVPEEWIPFMPVKKLRKVEVVEVVPPLKFGRRVTKGK